MVGGVVCLKETESVENKKTCQVSRIFVHPDCRRMGVASKLFQGAKIEALKLGYKILSVETFETNVEMIEFCNKKNFGHSSSKLVADVYPLTFSVVHFQMDLVKSKVFSWRISKPYLQQLRLQAVPSVLSFIEYIYLNEVFKLPFRYIYLWHFLFYLFHLCSNLELYFNKSCSLLRILLMDCPLIDNVGRGHVDYEEVTV